MSAVQIIPAILSDSSTTVQEQINRIITESATRRVQIDIVDPSFADESTIFPVDLLEMDLKGLSVDIHLMTNDPIDELVECGHVPGITNVIAQIERMDSQIEYIRRCQEFGLHPGFSLDLYTPVDSIEEEALSELSVIQVMGNKAGVQGQEFAGARILEKIQQLSEIQKKKQASFVISVDIGMTPETATNCIEAGAGMIVVGSFLWGASNLQSAIEAFSVSP